MALLTKAAEDKLIALIIAEGLADYALVAKIKDEVDPTGKSVHFFHNT